MRRAYSEQILSTTETTALQVATPGPRPALAGAHKEHVLLQLREAFAAFRQDPVNWTQDFFKNSEYANNVLLVIVALTCKILANGLRRRDGEAAPAAAPGKKKK